MYSVGGLECKRRPKLGLGPLMTPKRERKISTPAAIAAACGEAPASSEPDGMLGNEST